MDQQKQPPPPYSEGTSASYPTKPGGQTGPAPMQPGYGTNPGYAMGNPSYPPNTRPTVTTTTTRTVVQQQPPVLVNAGFMCGELPVSMKCPACQTQIVTATEYEPGALSWLACCGLAAVGCAFGCCFIPFCINEMKDVTHTCPNCKVVVGVYRRL